MTWLSRLKEAFGSHLGDLAGRDIVIRREAAAASSRAAVWRPVKSASDDGADMRAASRARPEQRRPL